MTQTMMMRTALNVLLLFAGLAATPLAQAPQPPSPDTIRAAAFDIMSAARYCTMITVGPDGQPQGRIVDPLVIRDETSIWIATNPLARKVKEIDHNPRVTLVFFNQPGNEYVTVLGRARVVTAAAERGKRWKPEWAAIYKDQGRGPDFLLFELRPFRLEVSSVGRGLVNDPKTWRPIILDIRSGGPRS